MLKFRVMSEKLFLFGLSGEIQLKLGSLAAVGGCSVGLILDVSTLTTLQGARSK